MANKQFLFYFFMAFFLVILLMHVLQQQNKKNTPDNRPNKTVETLSDFLQHHISQKRKTVQQTDKYLPEPPENIQNSIFPPKPVRLYQINMPSEKMLFPAGENNALFKTNLATLKKVMLTRKKNNLFVKKLPDPVFSEKEKTNMPSIGFSQCSPNKNAPDSLSQKLTFGQKNHDKENIFPIDPLNCGLIQTSFPISF